MNSAAPDIILDELDPLEIDPRPCELCGRTIDQHECIDDGEGPQFYCYPDDDIVMCWEMSDPRDAWRHTGEAAPPETVRNSDLGANLAPASRPYRTPQSTVDAFFCVVRQDDAEQLRAWLRNHPRDAAFLLKLWKDKDAR